MAWYPIYNLQLAGWNRQSVWGWDPGAESYYAQLTSNAATFDADEVGPEIWVTRPTYPRIEHPARLAEVIAAVTGTGVEVVRTAMRDSLDERDELRQRI
ncbi:hypothetical protein ACQP1S_11920 [Micromonospora matsumotoense]|uniref:hypothetical protein n=1 Tax=Micromonospora matsumotoense TaxID=121616 RepID=UPI003D93251C